MCQSYAQDTNLICYFRNLTKQDNCSGSGKRQELEEAWTRKTEEDKGAENNAKKE